MANPPDNQSGTITANPKQSFGTDPTKVRESEHYTSEYVTDFVEKWDDLIDWRRRYESEGTFFVDMLKSRNVRTVLDVAAGTGFHSVRLLEEGFHTVSADGSPEMLVKAFDNGRDFGHVMQVVHADWRWLNRDIMGRFDAVICLGNSFTHLFSERDRRKALAEFYSVLKHDGILILDQRNYDAMLDEGFSSKHTYYYAGEDVTAEPEFLDEGLARFAYTFPDGLKYHLNMFPLRKDYTRKLLREVGFQRVNTYGDFQETFVDSEPDFLVHVAEKSYHETDDPRGQYSNAVHTARDYYNSSDADSFYFTVWGGEDIHVGLYDTPDEDIRTASRRTVEQMAAKVALGPDDKVVDIGAGYGGAARYLAATHGCQVDCLNLSEVENERNREMNRKQGLDGLVNVTDGSFEDLPYEDNSFDVVWSQDALLHSGDRIRVLQEIARVLKPHGRLVFTDPMAADNCDRAELRPILQRINLESMGAPQFYRRELAKLGAEVEFDDRTPQLATHYGRVLAELKAHEAELADKVSEEYRTKMKAGLQHWVEGGNGGNLAWGIFTARF